jgi:hypothetical protein
MMTFPLRTRRAPRWLVAAGSLAAIIVCAMVLAASSAAATPARTSQPGREKASAPMNVNPGKHPVTDPARLTIQPPVPVPVDQAVRAARAWEAQDPNSRVACFAADGTPTWEAEIDQVDPSRPITASQRAELCARMPPAPPGSER